MGSREARRWPLLRTVRPISNDSGRHVCACSSCQRCGAPGSSRLESTWRARQDSVPPR
jgi:hypothetical protein